MEISQIQLIESGDLYFKVSFMYGTHNLETPTIPRNSDEDSVKDAIRVTVTAWEAARADDNFNELKRALEDKVITL